MLLSDDLSVVLQTRTKFSLKTQFLKAFLISCTIKTLMKSNTEDVLQEFQREEICVRDSVHQRREGSR